VYYPAVYYGITECLRHGPGWAWSCSTHYGDTNRDCAMRYASVRL